MSNTAVQPARMEHEAIEGLLCPHIDRLQQYLKRHIPADLCRFIDPQDVVQDTLFAASRSAETAQFDDAEAVWRWLVTIARHRLIQLIKWKRRFRRGGDVKHCYDNGDPEASVVAML